MMIFIAFFFFFFTCFSSHIVFNLFLHVFQFVFTCFSPRFLSVVLSTSFLDRKTVLWKSSLAINKPWCLTVVVVYVFVCLFVVFFCIFFACVFVLFHPDTQLYHLKYTNTTEFHNFLIL